jgi:phosphate transport system permease protein
MEFLDGLRELIKNPRSSIARLTTQKLGFGLLTLTTLVTVIPIFAVVIYILVKGAPAISWSFLTTFPYDGVKQGGILPAIIGTFSLTLDLLSTLGDRSGYIPFGICPR